MSVLREEMAKAIYTHTYRGLYPRWQHANPSAKGQCRSAVDAIMPDLEEYEGYVRNALEELSKHRSYVREVFTSPLDEHARDNLLDGINAVESNLLKALL